MINALIYALGLSLVMGAGSAIEHQHYVLGPLMAFAGAGILWSRRGED